MTSMTGNSPSGEMKSLPVRGWFTEDGDDMSISSDISMLIYIYILIGGLEHFNFSISWE